MNRPLIFSFLSAVVLLVSFFFIKEIKQENTAFVKNKMNAVEILNFENRLLNTDEWLFPEQQGYRKVIMAQKQYYEADEHYELAWSIASWLLGILVLYFFISAVISYRTHFFPQFLSLSTIVICFVLLTLGVLIPMLEIGAYNNELTIPVLFSTADVPLLNQVPYLGDIDIDLTRKFEGKMYYYYQNKSISDVVGLLWVSQNYVVAIAIILFSIGVPFFKLIGSAYYLISRKVNPKSFFYKLLGKIGKWSMADVFVVAAFLAYLSFYNMNTGIDTEANTLMGLYFFLSYVVLSIVASHMCDWALKGK